ncbi:MAG TPA: urease subunit beta [Thiobacillus sp.]
MKNKPNPFEVLRKNHDGPAEAKHASDDPGRMYEGADAEATEGRTRSSGEHSPSEPRRPGAGLRQAPRTQSTDCLDVSGPMIPGEILYGDGDVEINIGMPVTTIRVINAADRPVQIGSHYHFAEVNDALEFDRKAAWGKRLNVLSGGAVRFEPGAVEEVELVPIQGRRVVPGLRGLCGGALDE